MKMNFLFEIVICVCAASVADCLIMQYIPKEVMKKGAQLACAIVFCAFVVFKIANINDADFLKTDFKEEKVNAIYSQNARKAFSKSLERNIEKAVLKNFEDANVKVSVVADMNENYELEVISVVLDINGADKYAVKSYVSDEYKISSEKIII